MPDCDEAVEPANVLLLAGEDAGDAIRRNLQAAGADLERVHVLDACADELDGALVLPAAAEAIAEDAAAKDVKLLVLSPITAFLGGTGGDAAVRKALAPLLRIAEQENLAVLAVRHLVKARHHNPMYAGAGSAGMIALARSAMLVGLDPVDANRRVLASIKSNLGGLAPSLSFAIEGDRNGAVIRWLGRSDFDAAEVLAGIGGHDRSATEEAVLLLYHALCEGPLPVLEVKALARNAGISGSVLNRTKRLMGIKSQHRGFGKGSRFFWALPDGTELVRRLHARRLVRVADQLQQSEDWLGDGATEPEVPESTEGQLIEDGFTAVAASESDDLMDAECLGGRDAPDETVAAECCDPSDLPAGAH